MIFHIIMLTQAIAEWQEKYERHVNVGRRHRFEKGKQEVVSGMPHTRSLLNTFSGLAKQLRRFRRFNGVWGASDARLSFTLQEMGDV